MERVSKTEKRSISAAGKTVEVDVQFTSWCGGRIWCATDGSVTRAMVAILKAHGFKISRSRTIDHEPRIDIESEASEENRGRYDHLREEYGIRVGHMYEPREDLRQEIESSFRMGHYDGLTDSYELKDYRKIESPNGQLVRFSTGYASIRFVY